MNDKKAQQANEAALREYGKTQIQHIKQQKDLLECKQKHKQRKHIITPKEAILEQNVPEHLVCMLRLKAFREEMRRGAEQDFHEPSRCTACLAKRADLALDFFMRNKKSQLQTHLLEDKIQDHVCNKDTVCLLGEMLKYIPKPSDEPGEIWKKLLSERHKLHNNK
ncbi:uncharacterized protein C8orf48 [Electrophorus electricus]|uniref:Uncharacterized protein n=1 Tax=Electrophorus electricus TaxID=8005 RepID=A0A4W4DXP5_ELEEL|nr:uncharacterized protein C8orf48 [Electrophorus electricus]